jgi:hypothetical protein
MIPTHNVYKKMSAVTPEAELLFQNDTLITSKGANRALKALVPSLYAATIDLSQTNVLCGLVSGAKGQGL